MAEVSKWPSREEQISILVGQILGPGARLAAQLIGSGRGPGQPDQAKGKGEDEEAAPQRPNRPQPDSGELRLASRGRSTAARCKGAAGHDLRKSGSFLREDLSRIIKRRLRLVSLGMAPCVGGQEDAEESERIDSDMATDAADREFSAATKELGDKIVR